ncbi:hypothetical protein [uncultured Endozoicomonas sp.]|uniref:hypothetical protein n=1 Tax=uncultured Endozoicomonas sp. TaxID=432652 RepID=UPI00261801BE|nr:hypothetical protein [uncultured Endozoicomonas sp.]
MASEVESGLIRTFLSPKDQKQIPVSLTRLNDQDSYCKTLSNFMKVMNGELEMLVEVKNVGGNYQELSAEERMQEAKAIRKEFNSVCI